MTIADQGCDIGMVGLGVMGQNLLLNIADQGFSAVGFDGSAEKTKELINQAGNRDLRGATSLRELASWLKRPRSIILLVPAGPPVDSVIEGLLPYLDPSDLLIDSGNSYFKDTNRRAQLLSEKSLVFIGMGISGGEDGARRGPSLMPGGPQEGYERIRPILEKVAAQVQGEPCVAHLGNGSAGHYVKMVHNGIEYGLMQLIAETYDLLKRGLGLGNDALHEVFTRWGQTELSAYLLEITANIFLKRDPGTGQPLVDLILDEAEQKGTGKWTSWEAMELRVPTPTIDMAVMMRDLSGFKSERKTAKEILHGPDPVFSGDKAPFLRALKNALYLSMILTYAQGMALLRRASDEYAYHLDLEAVARIWRGGCIIRAALLEDIRTAFSTDPELPNVLLDPHLGHEAQTRQGDLRSVVRTALDLGLPAPAMMASLAFYDAYRSEWLPANLTQAQRDYFGSHTYRRIDEAGVFHTQWAAG
jgi:6-phosphogluconate dehydrogenase